MYIDFHMLPPCPFVVVYLFCTSPSSPLFRSAAPPTRRASSTRPSTMRRPRSTTPKSLLTPASWIAPHLNKYSGNLRLLPRSRARRASAARPPTPDGGAALLPNGGCGWTLDQQRLWPFPFLCETPCPPLPAPTHPSLMSRCATTYGHLALL